MPKRKGPADKPKDQSKRFTEAAKRAGVTEDDSEFDDAFRKIIREKPPKSASSGKMK